MKTINFPDRKAGSAWLKEKLPLLNRSEIERRADLTKGRLHELESGRIKVLRSDELERIGDLFADFMS
mgnify:CR=1 FL=1|tara:strand:+ start:1835 stop:2038 length:204 start_codon:yes stop_codon:yes gene_type:complete